MRKFKELKLNEKLLLISAVLLVIMLVFKLPKVKEGFLKSFDKLGITIFTNKE